MGYITFIASTNSVNSSTYNIGQTTTEWDSWKEVCKEESDKDVITIEVDGYKVFIIKAPDEWDNLSAYIEGKTNLKNSDFRQSEIYIHGNTAQVNAYCQAGIKSGSYSSQNINEPLFKAVKELMQSLRKSKTDVFFKIKGLQRFACVKYIRYEIRELSLSLLLDVAGYKECESKKCAKYLEAILEANAGNKLKKKVRELKDITGKDITKLEEHLNDLCAQIDEILPDKRKGKIKNIQESYSELINTVDSLYES